MILFVIYVEPLSLKLQEVLPGFNLCAPLRLQPHSKPVVGANTDQENYVDDLDGILNSEADFLIVDNVVRMLEGLSGAILNRDFKSKVLGLGAWKGRTIWPLSWLKSVEQIKIFGIIFHPDPSQLLHLNWDDQFKKVSGTLNSWGNRALDSLSERSEVISTFALSRIWYRAQVLPMTPGWASKFEGLLSNFLWRGFQCKNLLPAETICQPKLKGGLNIPYLRSKCDALLLKQLL